MKAGTAELLTLSERYYDLAQAAGFDYAALWRDHGPEIGPLLDHARLAWTEEAHGNYEFNEGMVAGVPSLAFYDTRLDAGPSRAEDPAGALDVQLELPDGRVLDKPGNLFHALTEPALWGTDEDFVGLRLDMGGDGQLRLGEALPEANVLLGSTRMLDDATAQLQAVIAGWQPRLSDAFTALVVMIPTMYGYFQEWKLSPFVIGEASTQRGFVATSRLVDVLGILRGLTVTYGEVAPLVEQSSPALAAQIEGELDGIVAFVADLQARDQAGDRFTPEQADQFGGQRQTRATSLAGQIPQAAALLGVRLDAA